MIHYVGILQFVLGLNLFATVSRCGCHFGKTLWLFLQRTIWRQQQLLHRHQSSSTNQRNTTTTVASDNDTDSMFHETHDHASLSLPSPPSMAQRRHRQLLYGRYLPVYLLAVSADWLQGPYKYSVYSAYGYSLHDISLLFVAGFGSGMTLGSILGGWADVVGRKRCVLAYCVIYAASCLAKHFRPFYILLIGRVLGGIATSLLFSVFDAWLIRAHALKNITDGGGANPNSTSASYYYLAKSFSAANYGSSIVAILAGLLAHAVVEGASDDHSDGGSNKSNPLRPAFPSAQRVWEAQAALSGTAQQQPTAVNDARWNTAIVYQGGGILAFDVALIPLVLCFILAFFMWDENYGDDSCKHEKNPAKGKNGDRFGMFTAIRTASWTVWRSPDIFNLCIVSSFFEGAMYVFILLWTPTLRALDNNPPGPPLGIVFATFMVCCMLGTSVFSTLTSLGVASSRILVCILLLSAVSCYIIYKSADALFSYTAMLLFEFCIGAYFPAMSTVKSSIVPENERAAIYNVFRLPLNLIVLLNLLTNLSYRQSFGMCTMMLGVATVLQSRMAPWEERKGNNRKMCPNVELPLISDTETEALVE